MPQLAEDGIEKSGTSIPARRDPGGSRFMKDEVSCKRGAATAQRSTYSDYLLPGMPAILTSRMCERQHAFERGSEDLLRRQQADDHECRAGKVEEVAGMGEHALLFEQRQDE